MPPGEKPATGERRPNELVVVVVAVEGAMEAVDMYELDRDVLEMDEPGGVMERRGDPRDPMSRRRTRSLGPCIM
jgi:hypothetical protein